jgi:hypothetical protein
MPLIEALYIDRLDLPWHGYIEFALTSIIGEGTRSSAKAVSTPLDGYVLTGKTQAPITVRQPHRTSLSLPSSHPSTITNTGDRASIAILLFEASNVLIIAARTSFSLFSAP